MTRRLRIQEIRLTDGSTGFPISVNEALHSPSGNDQVLELDHYLEVLNRKPGAMTGATALVVARAGGAFSTTHQWFWDKARRELGDGTRALIGVLRLARTLPPAAVLTAMGIATAAGTTTPTIWQSRPVPTSHYLPLPRRCPSNSPAGCNICPSASCRFWPATTSS